MKSRNLLTESGLRRVLSQSYCEVNRTILWTDVIDADKDLRLLLHMPNTAIEQEIDSVLYQIFLFILLLNEIKSVHNLLR